MDQIDEYLEKASAMPEAEREAYIGTLPGEIGEQIRKFLAADLAVQQGNLLNPVTGNPDQLDGIKEIGPYEMVSVLGKGGMGTVYEAQQHEPIKRRVALKLINAGMDSAGVVARFEAERQALALMNHPNIARVIDGGTSSSGRPYFVMELVDGIPLDQFCAQHQLTTRERLGLFQQICDAVQHAHQQGIIHRDLKPSNILVAEVGGTPVPKIIDFGLAKALHSDLTDRTIQTQFNQAMGTLQYMCPEQTELGNQQIDTRADIYSLGIVLYELLTGSPPLDSDTIKSMALDQVFSMIRETDFPRPSRRLQSSMEAIPASEVRNSDSTMSELSGDLDWIVMKAIEKDRDRRYGSASEFAADINRHLNHEVVLARPPSMSYTMGKFVNRNRGFVIASGLIAALLVVSSMVSTVLYFRAEMARKGAFEDRQAAVVAKTEAEKQTIAKQQAIDKLDDAATVSMARLGDFAMQTGKPAEAAIWFSAAAKNAINQPHRTKANLIRLADAADKVTIPDAAFFVGIGPVDLDPHPTNRYLIVRDRVRTIEVWDVDNETPVMTGRAADWIENGLVVATANKLRWHELPSLKVIATADIARAIDVTVSDDSKWISVCTGTQVKIYQVGEGKLQHKYDFEIEATSSYFNPDASHLIAYSKGTTSLLQLSQENSHQSPSIKWSQPTVVLASFNYALRPRFIGDSTDVLMVSPNENDVQIRDLTGQLLSTPESLYLGPPELLGLALDSTGTRLGAIRAQRAATYELKIERVDGDKRQASVKLLGEQPGFIYQRDVALNDDGSLLFGQLSGLARIANNWFAERS